MLKLTSEWSGSDGIFLQRQDAFNSGIWPTRCRLAEHVCKERRGERASLGARGVGAASDLRRPTQQANDPPLLVKWRESDRHIEEHRHIGPWHSRARIL